MNEATNSLTPEMIQDAQAAFAAEIRAGVNPAAALNIALSAAFENDVNRERKGRRDDALRVRHAIFSNLPESDDIQRLISYLVFWHTDFNTDRLSRITGHPRHRILAEVETWLEANPGRLIFDSEYYLYRTPRNFARADRREPRTESPSNDQH